MNKHKKINPIFRVALSDLRRAAKELACHTLRDKPSASALEDLLERHNLLTGEEDQDANVLADVARLSGTLKLRAADRRAFAANNDKS